MANFLHLAKLSILNLGELYVAKKKSEQIHLLKTIIFPKSTLILLRRAASLSQPFPLAEGSFLLIHNVVADPVHAILPG